MTNSEFLDDVERRARNGGIFAPTELARLYQLAGNSITSVDLNAPQYMRQRAVALVSIARAHAKKLAMKRLKEPA